MAIKSLGYIGISSQQTGAWREFACGVMGLEDVSARCNAQQDEAYFKMDDHPYRLFVSPGDTESLQVCGWETNSAEGLQEVADALSRAGVDFTWGDSALIARRRVQNVLCFQDPSGNDHEAFWGVVSDLGSSTPQPACSILSMGSKAWDMWCYPHQTLMKP